MLQLSPWKKILVFGSHGQLASALKSILPPEKSVFKSHTETNFNDSVQLLNTLNEVKPDLVINTSAYTQVDKAEEDVTACKKVNASAPGLIAEWCASHKSFLIHFSTDYVFDGVQSTPYSEQDPTNPLNVYGQTKLLGEDLIRESGASHLTFRTSWLFHESGKNFIKAMLRLGKEKEELRVVDDQISSPTYTGDLARAVTRLLDQRSFSDLPKGLYHLANEGYASRLELATAVFQEAQKYDSTLKVQKILPAKSTEFPTPALRPLSTKLDCSKAKKDLGLILPDWQEGLHRSLRHLYVKG